MATAVVLKTAPGSTKNIFPINNNLVTIIKDRPTVHIEHNLPFRVKFTAIKVPGYTQTNVPPIPLQIIGFSNYIL